MDTINATQVFFSIVITSYNRASYLPRALDSLLAQTEKDWEAIIVNDGSTDHTDTVILPYLQHKNIHYIKQNNQGCVGAKNKGIQFSTGKYISFLDSDDEYKTDHLAIRKSILLANPKIDLLHGGVQILGSHYVPDMHQPGQLIDLKDCAIGGTFFINHSLAHQLNGFHKIEMGHDADFLLRAELANFIIKKIDHPTYIYHRELEDSMTNKLRQ
ncbi:MAG: glycosyltransferase family 2 protein [Chitinophagaceae bacterium]|nr:MAG: glycosyltransferase family 2 protein [Chitinophagaceae bacterium]